MISLDELIQKLQQNFGKQRVAMLQEVAREVSCMACEDTGMVYSGEAAWVCDCQRLANKPGKQAGIAPELQGYSFEGFRIEYYDGKHRERALAALQGARDFARDYIQGRPSQGIMFTGDVGSGKTFLAAATANELLNRRIHTQFLVVPDFLDDLRTALLHNAGGREMDDVALLRSIRQVDVLVLDDLGVHNYTEWTCNKLYSLLNYRLNNQLPVIITTNLKMSELDEYLGERTTSRIVQMCRIFRLTVERDIRHIQTKRSEV
jgi:DNA replication protein DnaC